MKLTFSTLLVLISIAIYGQNRYQIDPNFQFDAVRSSINSFSVKEQADGKILVGGNFEIVEGSNLSHLVRLNADGTIDETFNTQGTGPATSVEDIEVLDDGKILIAMRQGRYYNGEEVSSVIRLNADGSLDNSFQAEVFLDNNFRFNNSAFAIDVQSDGKIIVAGSFFRIGDIELNGIARLNADGTVDNTFITGDGFGSSFNTEIAAPSSQVITLSNGNLAVLGAFDNYAGNDANTFAIIGGNGAFVSTVGETLDRFVFPTVFDAEGFVIEQTDGKIIIANDNNDTDKRFIRLNTDGTVDNTFDNSLANEAVVSLGEFSDGRLLLHSRDLIAITDENGVVDDAINLPNDLNRTYLINDNTIIGESSEGEAGFELRKYDASGTQMSFNSPRFFGAAIISSFVKESDNSFLFAGSVNPAQGDSFSDELILLGRVSTDGVIDQTFNPQISGFITGITANADASIWIWGDISQVNSQAVSNIIKLNADGTIDDSFSTGTGFDRRVEQVRFQNDGKLVVVGDFEEYNGIPASNIVRLNSDGTIDDTYLTGIGFDRARPEGLELQPDGKAIIFDGNIEEYNGFDTGRIVRLNTDGTLDMSFDIGTGFQNSFTSFGQVVEQEAIKILPNGQILVGGEFDSFNGHNTQGIARINNDGSVDTDFVAAISQIENYFGTVRDIQVGDNNEIFISGIFESANGTLSRGFAMLEADGDFVESFDIERDIQVIGNGVLLDDDAIYLMGRVKGVAGSTYAGIVRFFDLTPSITDQSFSIAENSVNGTTVGTVEANVASMDALNFTIESGNELGGFSIDVTSGEITVEDMEVLDFETNPNFNLVIRAQVSDASVSTSADITIDLTDVDETVLSISDDLQTKQSIYPNPAQNTIILPDNYRITSYVIRDQTGKELFRNSGNINEIDVSSLKPGIFFLELTGRKNTVEHIKFIKE